MGILDNSGDIILDAVLTETGRKKMAAGTFNIGWFSFGDDEINYGLYDLNHTSGSAYYDLEILQTPIMEATTAKSANINYGLATYNNQRLLYLPVMMRNAKTALSDIGMTALPDGEITYVAVNDGSTFPALKTALGDAKAMLSGQTTGRIIVLETGLDTTEIAATTQNRSAYLANQNLLETGFSVSFDNRFITSLLRPAVSSFIDNGGINGGLQASVTLRSGESAGSGANGGASPLSNRTRVTIPSFSNNIVYRQTDTTVATTLSAITGPRGNWCGFGLLVRSLTTTDFSKHGYTAQNLFGDGNTYNYLDTEIEVIGTGTGITDQVPIRIIQKV